MELKLALKVNDLDNVATVFASDVTPGSEIEVRDKNGRSQRISVHEPIPYGHKIALRIIRIKERIIKYGEEIGVAAVEIGKGDYVHIHNLDSMRGRGDLEQTTFGNDKPRCRELVRYSLQRTWRREALLPLSDNPK